MVQFLTDPGKYSFAEGLLKGASETLPDALSQYTTRKRQEKERKAEDAALKKKGIDVEGISDPKVRQMLLDQQLTQQKSTGNLEEDLQRKEIMTKYFGPEVSEIYGTLTEGGKTKFTEVLLDGKLRGMDLKETFKEFIEKNPQEAIETLTPATQQVPKGESPVPMQESTEEFQFPEIPAPTDLTPKELPKYKMNLRKENAPLFQEATTQLRGLEKIENDLNQLDKLNQTGKLPNGIGRFLVDREGNIRPLAQVLGLVPPQAERFVKIVNDFTTKAKDSYGARVTNFELDRFMKRLPTLLNSEEGRSAILKQMQITNAIDRLYNDAIKKTFKHYKLDGISQEQVDDIIQQMIEPKQKELKAQYDQIEQDTNSKIAKSKTPKGRVAVEIDGKIGHVPENQVDLILQKGGRKL